MPRKPELKLVKSTQATARSGRGRFVKGAPKPPNAGRARGTRNKMTLKIREAILEATERSGQNGRGLNGAVGYLVWLSRTEPAVFGRMLERIMPLQVDVADRTDRTMNAAEAVERLESRKLPVPPLLRQLAEGISQAVTASEYEDELDGRGYEGAGVDDDDENN